MGGDLEAKVFDTSFAHFVEAASAADNFLYDYDLTDDGSRYKDTLSSDLSDLHLVTRISCF